MRRPVFPPRDFVCSYEHNCPYLDGLSTTWVLGEYRRGQDSYQEHLRINDFLDQKLDAALKRNRELERELVELRAKYQALHQKQFKPNHKKNGFSDEKGFEKQPGQKKLGAPVGHSGWFRPKPIKIDRSVQVSAPKQCPHCSSTALTPVEDRLEHIQEDIVLVPSPLVTRYIHEQAFCTHCRRPVVQAAADEILHAPIGPVAKATAMYLRYEIGIPYRKVVEIFKILFGLSYVPASLVGFDKKAAKMGEPIYADLREKIRESKMVTADETS
ncbi:MAG: hypothetical protein C0407_17185 [Desulfobacca sp.]|nr:hypothetical protein [Desulfobacca sp.]